MSRAIQILKQSKTIKHAKLRFDQRGEKLLRDEIRTYLSHQLDNKKNDVFTDLKFVDSKQNTLIQLADMAAGSIAWAYGEKSKIFLRKLQKAGQVEDIWEFK